MARHGGLVRLLVTLILLLLATLLAAATAAVAEAAAPAEVEVELAPVAPAQNASKEAVAAEQQPPPLSHILPRPLIIELPSSAAARAAGAEEVLGDVPADAVAASLEVKAEVDLVPAAPAQDTSEEVAADAQQHLPRPLVIDLPSSAAGPRDGDDEGLDDVPADVRCASWRLAAEANNLAPWKAVPAECAAHVRDYVTGVAYRSDLELVARESAAYARAAPLRGDGRDAWVFDVDETLLSNLPYYADHGYGLELFDHQKFDRWVERGEARAIPSSLNLYNEVRELGFKTFLLTGRSEGHQGVTMENLKEQGFHDWDKLILRAACDREKTATAYKSEKRKEMEEQGYRILGNSGDQWSDLLGSPMSVRSFKLPNPMYYIP
ncbi:acid phosphatase 1-like isoform X1 [Panicum miliaceum]|uniref:Acid phosphatase 1-like isoform X1 n=1 Tax=Panicum miliaceum TaxID=4540 RepID=A0A3L6RZC9_PANMI|nr:acid phosphatase 1-like isoform X1 [Panicum miliaceum]